MSPNKEPGYFSFGEMNLSEDAHKIYKTLRVDDSYDQVNLNLLGMSRHLSILSPGD